MKHYKTNEAILNEVKEVIEEQLLRRGFTAKIKTIAETNPRHNDTKISFDTYEFNTTPVLFKSITCSEFSSSIDEERIIEKSGKKVYKIWISIYASWTHFGGGTNGTQIFSMSAEFVEGGDRLHNVKFK